MFIDDKLLLSILVLSALALLIVFVLLRKKRKGKFKLEKDSSGLWRYHKETQFQKKLAYKNLEKKKDKKQKSDSKENKEEKKSKEKQKSVAVISFSGDIRAKGHNTLAKLVDEVEINKDEIEEVVVVVNSPGGMVSQYGHAYSQMERVRNLDLNLTVCIDVVAASGGYLMSLPAHKIIAAPFAMVGSIGVMAFVPNFREFLVNMKINPRTFTAGKYKRTISLTDQATQEEVAHFEGQLESIHKLFSSAVAKYRTSADVDEVTTGDHWSAAESVEKELGLVDELGTSQQYLLSKNKDKDVVYISQKKGMFEDGFFKFASITADIVEQKILSLWRGF